MANHQEIKQIHIKLSTDIHMRLKIQAVSMNKTIQDFVVDLITENLNSIEEEKLKEKNK